MAVLLEPATKSSAWAASTGSGPCPRPQTGQPTVGTGRLGISPLWVRKCVPVTARMNFIIEAELLHDSYMDVSWYQSNYIGLLKPK